MTWCIPLDRDVSYTTIYLGYSDLRRGPFARTESERFLPYRDL